MADIQVTVPNPSFTVTKPNTSFAVTTPADQTINLGNPSIAISITKPTIDISIDDIGITNTDQLIEGNTNLFFTNARARSAISLVTNDSTILSYNSGTGVFTWTTPTTTKIAEGTNLYFTDARADARANIRIAASSINALADVDTATTPPVANQVLGWNGTTWIPSNAASIGAVTSVNGDAGPAVSLNTDDIPEGTSLYFTPQRVDDHQFTTVKIDNKLVIDTSTEINTNDTATQIIDSWPKAQYRTVKYIIQASQSTRWQTVEALVIHDGADAYVAQYADIKTDTNLIGSITADIAGSQVTLSVTPTSATATTFRVTKILMTI